MFPDDELLAKTRGPLAGPARALMDRCEAEGRWFQLFEFEPDETRAIVDGLFAAGAFEVWAVEVEDEEEFLDTNELVAELPADPDAGGPCSP